MNTSLNNRYYLMRHGESLANKQGLIVSHPGNAIDNFGLTTNGANQVSQAALNTRLSNDTIIISSDYKRAVETAEIMHNVLSMKSAISYDCSLRERDFGSWELSSHENYEAIWQQDVENSKTTFKNNVESVQQVLERGIKTIQRLESEFKQQSILIVGHGDVLQILFAYYQNIDPRFHRSLNPINNADIRQLVKTQVKQKLMA